MIDLDKLREIAATYRKYGWVFRRLLLDGPRDTLAIDLEPEFDDIVIADSDVPAAWFSRPPVDGPVAWEIRYLGDPPFALVEKLDENDVDFEAALSAVQTRLKDAVAARRTA